MKDTKVTKHIQEINSASEMDLIEYNFDEFFTTVEEMRDAMILFIDRVNKGEVRSIKTYNQFKTILGIK